MFLKPFFLVVADAASKPSQILDRFIMDRVVKDVLERNAKIAEDVAKNIPYMR